MKIGNELQVSNGKYI